jgi:hypothetical protein
MVIDSGRPGEIAPALSLTVTLKLNGLPLVEVGLPLIAPVVEAKANPGGSVPEFTVQTV